MSYIEPEGEAKFNAGIQKLMRIDHAKQDMHIARVNRIFDVWLNCLITIKCELSERMTEEQYNNTVSLEYKINDLIETCKNKTKHMNQGFNIIKMLNEYDRILAQIEKKAGMGMPMRRDRRGL